MKTFKLIIPLVVILILLLVPIAVQAASSTQEADVGIEVTPEMLASFAGVSFSLLFSYTPGLRTKFAALATEYQRLIMLAILIAVTGGILGLTCAGYAPDIGLNMACNRSGIVGLVTALISAVIANQSAFSLTPQTADVKRVRTKRKLTGI